MKNLLNNKIAAYSKWKMIVFVGIIIVLSALSYGKALGFNFTDEDWVMVWLGSFNRIELKNWLSYSWHPGQGIIINPWLSIFGDNHLLWELFGLFVKIINSFLVGLVVYSLSGNVISFFLGSLLYSAYFGGFEAYSWAAGRMSIFLIPIMCLTMYFFFAAYRSGKKVIFGLSLIGMSLCLIMDPFRTLPFVGILLFWQIFSNLTQVKANKEHLKNYLINKVLNKNILIPLFSIIVVSLLSLSVTSIGRSVLFLNSSSASLDNVAGGFGNRLIGSLANLRYFMNSLGNLLIYNVNPFEKFSRFGISSIMETYLGGIFIFLTLLLVCIFFRIKQLYLLNLLVFAIWIPILYFPNWLVDVKWVSSVYHRTQAVSGIGLVIGLSYLLTLVAKKKIKVAVIIVAWFLISNLIIATRINDYEYKIRGYGITNPILTKIRDDLPENFNRGGIWLETSELNMATYFGSAGNLAPYISFIKGVTIPNDVVMIPGMQLGPRLLCETGLEVPGYFKNFILKEPLNLADIYGWKIHENMFVENISDEIRIKLAHASDCNKKIINKKLSYGITVNSLVELNNLYDKDKQVVSLNWILNNSLKKFEVDIKLYSDKLLVKDQLFEDNSPQEMYYTNVFIDKNLKITSLVYTILNTDNNSNPINNIVVLD